MGFMKGAYSHSSGHCGRLKNIDPGKSQDVLASTTVALDKLIPGRFKHQPSNSSKNFTVVLVGKTGSGKSSFGNLLVGDSVFEVNSNAESVTTERQDASFKLGNSTVTVWDTPGFYDPKKNHVLALKELRRIYKGVREGIHTIALVARCESSVDAEKVYKKIKNKHPPDVLKYIILVLTHIKHQSVNTLLEDRFQNLAKEVKSRAIGVREESINPNNIEEQKALRESFLNIVQAVYEDNSNSPCTNLGTSFCRLF
ncbi:GTPase IMAP family member 4 [Holothuria leucospilota]|uniref:GTPase IMAP family member 4 n=1 Tax=Holothuria leucospilota TaxID=206669 RepID=A0A9Q1HFY2_HOLLE|nr:GTPase IMAP family member 4 [Holothuria leucospilota]